jgi:hypothetical protein
MRLLIKGILAGLLVVVASLVSAREFRFQRQVRVPMALAVGVVRGSAVVSRSLGAPLKASRIARGRCICDASGGTADLTFEVRGPQGRGTLTEWAQADRGQWSICSLQFKPADDSKTITLVDELLTHCERE